MTRISFAVLGLLFFVCWAIGWGTHANGWMVWGDFVLGVFSFKVSMAPVFTGDYRHDDVAPYAFAICLAGIALFIGDLFLAPAWMAVTTIIIAALYAALGAAYVLEGHRFHRPAEERLA